MTRRSFLNSISAAAPVGRLAPSARPAPRALLDAFGLSKATVQDLAVPGERRAFRLPVVLDGAVHVLDLRPNDIRTPDFQLLVDDGLAIRRLPTPSSVTFRGEVVGAPGSVVAASVFDAQFRAMISFGQHARTFGCEPVSSVDPTAPANRCVVFAVEDEVW